MHVVGFGALGTETDLCPFNSSLFSLVHPSNLLRQDVSSNDNVLGTHIHIHPGMEEAEQHQGTSNPVTSYLSDYKDKSQDSDPVD